MLFSRRCFAGPAIVSNCVVRQTRHSRIRLSFGSWSIRIIRLHFNDALCFALVAAEAPKQKHLRETL
jgi:hypothetical protein